MKDDITLCNGCYCMTHSIRKDRTNYICGKCGHNKTLGDVYQYVLDEKMKDRKMKKEDILKIIYSVHNWNNTCPFKKKLIEKIERSPDREEV